ncbi:hypothetical protein BH23VER1_BH23VER1_31380 [soil metagenome]
MEIPHTVHARKDTGLWNAKIGIWLFLASEVMLFGGLFSAYIFLRVSADYPWPIFELDVIPGAINTVVLIASSVTVVMAWASLKMRQFRHFQLYMLITLLCAAIFMVIKAIEYHGKFTHHNIELKDGSMVNGHHMDDGVQIDAVTSVTLAASSDLQHIRPTGKDGKRADLPLFTTEGVGEFELTKSWIKAQSDILKESSRRLAEDGVGEEGDSDEPLVLATLEPVQPYAITVSPDLIRARDESTVTLRDGTVIQGTVRADTVRIEPDLLDLQHLHDQAKDAAVFDHLPSAVREHFVKHYDETLAELTEQHPDSDILADPIFAKEILRMEVTQDMMHGAAHPPSETGGQGQEAGHGDDAHASIAVPREEIRRYTNFGPSKNNYYAIYFTLTGLHGLHVVGGAIVLAYFFFTGKKWYQRDPEHFANRVEVGGLFWHFVDLVWIVLFPLLYLL